jgi:hypothetical protein
MQTGLLAFAVASAFLGAALYINIVEQPARLGLAPPAMVQEWTPSNRRGFIMLAALAISSAILAYLDYWNSSDLRWVIGGVVILVTLPYTYFVMVPANIWLYAMPTNAPASTVRGLMRDWGLLEWGHAAIGVAACIIFGWALSSPA